MFRRITGHLAAFGVVCLLMAAGLWGLWHLTKLVAHYVAAARDEITPIPVGRLCPPIDATPGSHALSVEKTARGQAAIAFDAAQTLGERRGRYIDPRAALAKLYAGKDIDEVNKRLLNTRPWNDSGSTWWGHPSGDYDFSEIDFIAILYFFSEQPERLYPETQQHIVDTLIIEHGATPHPKVPRSLGLVVETENHILMKEGSRYLKNQWYFVHGNPEQRGNPIYDNDRNGLGAWLLEFLRNTQACGFYEFNSIPYLSYAFRAILNLEAFPANPDIRHAARNLLDVANMQYALGSLDLRRCAPFRRQPERAGLTDLQGDEHTAFMRVWAWQAGDPVPGPPFLLREETLAEAMPYRLPADIRQWVRAKREPYFVRFGHGPDASPELYSGGPDYLISAGGTSRGWRSYIVARPTTLLLRDGVTDLRDCFHLTGKGGWMEWNNTGVCGRFACSNGEVHIPKDKPLLTSSGDWKIYGTPCTPSLRIAVFNAPGLGLMAVFPDDKDSAEVLAARLAHANPNVGDLARIFHWLSGGSVSYDPNAPKGSWVITEINGQPTKRAYDTWPQLDGDGPTLAFAR